MATYGSNILPAFNSGWVLSNASVSGILLNMQAGGTAEYTWASENFHIGDYGYISLSVSSGVYYVYISYMDKSTTEVFTYTKRVSAGFSAEITLRSAVIDSLTARVYCLEAGSCSTFVFKASSISNTSGGSGSAIQTSNIRTFRSRFLNTHPSFDGFDFVDYDTQKYDTSTNLLNGLNNHSILHLGCQRSHEFCVSQLVVSLDPELVEDAASVKIDATTAIMLWDSEQPASTTGNPSYSTYPTKTEKFLKDYPVIIRLYFGDILLAEQTKILNYRAQKGFESINLSYTMYSDALLPRDRSQTIPLRICIKPENNNENDAYTSLRIAVDLLSTSIVATGPIVLREAYVDTGSTYKYDWNYKEPAGNFAVLYEPNSDIITKVLFTAGCKDSYNKIGFWTLDYDGRGIKTEQDALNTNLLLSATYNTSFYKKMEWAVVTDVRIPRTGDTAALQVTTSEEQYHVGLSTTGDLYFRYYTGTSTASFIIDTNVKDFDVVQCGLWQDIVTGYVSNPYDRIFGLTIFYSKYYEAEDERHAPYTQLCAACYPPIAQENVDIDTKITSISQFEKFTIDTPSTIGYIQDINISALYLFDNSPYPTKYQGLYTRSLIFGIVAHYADSYTYSETFKTSLSGCIHFDSAVWSNRNDDSSGKTGPQKYLGFYTDDFSTRNPGTGAYYCDDWGQTTITSDSTAYSKDELIKYGVPAYLCYLPLCYSEYFGYKTYRQSEAYADQAYGDTIPVHVTGKDDTDTFIPIRVLTTYCGDRSYFTNVNQIMFRQEESGPVPVYDYHLAIYGNLYLPTILDTYRIYPSRPRNNAYKRFDHNTFTSGAFSRAGAWPTPGTTAIIYNMIPSGKIAALQLNTRFLYSFNHYFTGVYFTESMMPQVHLNRSYGNVLSADDVFVYFPTNERTPLEMNYAFSSEALGASLRMCLYNNYLGSSDAPKASYQLMLQRFEHRNPYYNFDIETFEDRPKGFYNIEYDWQYITMNPNQRSVIMNVSDYTAKEGYTYTVDYWIADIAPKLPYLGYNTSTYAYSVSARPYRPNEFFYCGWGINA